MSSWETSVAGARDQAVLFAKDLFKDTVDAHSMGPQGLASWRIGIKA